MFTVSIQITNPDGQVARLDNAFSFDPAPVITSIEPSSGPKSGGTPVTILGANLKDGATVLFGSTPALDVIVSPDGTSLTCTTPAMP